MLNITNQQENANQNHNEIYYLIFVDSAVIKKNVNNKCKQECGEKRTLVHSSENINWFNYHGKQYSNPPTPKIKHKTTTWPRLGIYMKKRTLSRYVHPYAYCSIILNSQDMETTLVSINNWMDKDGVCVCIHTYINSSYNSISKKAYPIKKWAEELSSFLKRKCRRPTGTWKNAQHH